MRYRLAAVVALLALTAIPAAAQRPMAGISYDWSTPMGDASDFVNNDSWLGFTFDLRNPRGADGRTAVGLTLGYYEFYRMDPAASTQVIGATTVTGQQYRHAFSVPMMLNLSLYGGSAETGRARPYFGLNVGATYVKQTVDIGIYTLTSDALVVSAMPEVGILLARSRRSQFHLHARYHLPFGSDQLYSGGQSGASMQYLSVGIGFMGR